MTKTELRELKEIRKAVSGENAHFGPDTEMIKKRIRLHHQTWDHSTTGPNNR